MSRKRSSPKYDSRFEKEEDDTFEPPKKKKFHSVKTPKFTKKTLLKALSDVEDEIRKLKLDSRLRERVKDLRRQVKAVLEKHEDKFSRLHAEIDDLWERVEMLRAKNDDLSKENVKLMNTLDMAQATWLWEAHLARFVVDSSQEIYELKRFKQMNLYLTNVRAKDNLWIKLKSNIARWTGKHWNMVHAVRTERNGIAHPSVIDLGLIDTKLAKIFREYRKPMRNMLDILKTTASLMKFGRLAKFYKRNKKLFPHVRLSEKEKIALEEISSWDRRFEDIDGLQPVKHKEAKKYLDKYVNDPRTIKHYFHVVDLIKDGNSKRMGKLGWELGDYITKRITKRMTTEEHKVVKTLKRLVPKSTRNVDVLPLAITMLHLPDFLPPRLWKHGIKIVEKCGFFKR